MKGISTHCMIYRISLQQGVHQCLQRQAPAFSTLSPTYMGAGKQETEGSSLKAMKAQNQENNDTLENQRDISSPTNNSTPLPITTEDLVKKFKLKPSAEVGIRARKLERERKQAEEEAARKSREAEIRTGTERINRLFEKLQMGEDFRMTTPARTTPLTTEADPGATEITKASISKSWKFLFDEDDLGERKAKEGDSNGDREEVLDKIPGASTLFPALSEYRSPSSAASSAKPSSALTFDSRHTLSDRWKDPKMKSSERDAFKALFSSLFEQKKPQKPEISVGGKVQSLFSNFNRTGHEGIADSQQGSESTSSAVPSDSTAGHPPTAPDSTVSNTKAKNDPMLVLQRQFENLSKRVEPIYLDVKPSTSSFQVMQNTVGPHDWLSRDQTSAQENTIFNAIREENKVAIRMKKELDDKSGDIIKVQEFVDELILPFLESSSEKSSEVVRPSSVSLDSLLSRAILTASSTRLADSEGQRSLHPFLGSALVEHTRRQGLPVFIRTVRTESYKALLKSRWDAWNDGAGCLEILKQMQRSGALVDGDTLSLVRSIRKELKTRSLNSSSPGQITSKEQLRQYGWGDEEQLEPVLEMLNVIKAAFEDGDNDHTIKHWARRAGPRASNLIS
ncbi:hypothetical protein BX616_000604 [Lobosporangium transversale]|uniref:Mtf2-like C-terminal domain-containing protein n=1 Tax=Lobosporangium transversale TaxID=64571 RepID=A0A1Y2GL36_9FUNG|nr:hypothetical protein BCR41DRAFT_422618 [Lobosporangium transversale]KAF9917556.1 hypothetical protein BX616_000604 [Lobosporangium transversale]ORZ14383.1 hypothetical protein BCR41DRAFT_422618 [Lobosporangium transversale]|eukprot:XP_021880861.1 hypothetical protein BCR41DRAFT_422618 [Lobosporangium transversale]